MFSVLAFRQQRISIYSFFTYLCEESQFTFYFSSISIQPNVVIHHKRLICVSVCLYVQQCVCVFECVTVRILNICGFPIFVFFFRLQSGFFPRRRKCLFST